MATFYALFAFAIGSSVSEALSQSPKQRIVNQQVSLSDTSAITNGSQRVMNDLATQVDSLQSHMNQVNAKGMDSLQKQKAAFEQILSHQAHENSILKAQNEDIMEEIQKHRASSSKWRGQAESLALKCHKLNQGLHELSANMTLEQEFAHQTLNISTKMLEAPELRILEELAQEDAAKLYQSRLNDIAGDDASKLQMLQVGTGVAEPPQDLMQSLMASIDALSSQQNQSLVRMKANFDRAHQKGVELRTSLLEQQTKLNATNFHERNLDDRLHQAAENLNKTSNELSYKLSALRTFHARLGGERGHTASLPDSKVDGVVKAHEEKSQAKPVHEKPSVSNDTISLLEPAFDAGVKGHEGKKQAKPGHEEVSTRVSEQKGHPLKENERTKEKAQRLKHDKKMKHAKHGKQAEQAAPTITNDQVPAETRTEARIASGATNWLAPVGNGIKWILR